jgi:hypothetical protein
MNTDHRKLIADVSDRLEVPVEIVRVFACPVCRHISFAGILGPGSMVKVRCSVSWCVHHLPKVPWVVSVPGEEAQRLRIHRCQSPMCKNPCRVRGPHMDSEHVKYNNGDPVCNWTWCCAYFAPGTKIVAWCKESGCAQSKEGFTLIL